MSRRADVVRSNFTADPTTPRARGGGGGTILCCIVADVNVEGDPGEYNRARVGPIQVSVPENYQRVFVAATVSGMSLSTEGDAHPGLNVNIRTNSVGDISYILVPLGDRNACLTGASDLPAGVHDIYVDLARLGTAYARNVFFQVIVGQQVDSQECVGGGGGD